MSAEIKIIQLSSQDDFYLVQVESLFLELYNYIGNKGILLKLEKEGEKKWMQSVKDAIGKYSCLALALKDEKQVVGFGYGMIKFLPTFYGADKVGAITHFYVKGNFRKQNVGTEICNELYSWFKKQNTTSIEVQVAGKNQEAENFWNKMGFVHELTQYRKQL